VLIQISDTAVQTAGEMLQILTTSLVDDCRDK